MNPFIKNCRTGYYQDIFNKAAHYHKVLNSKTTIDNKHDNSHRALFCQSASAPKTKQQHKNKLMTSLGTIKHNSLRYTQNEEVWDKNVSLKNPYREKEKEKNIDQQNLRLMKKIRSVDSDFSMEKIKEFTKKMNKYSKLNHRPLQHISKMDQQFFETYQHQLYRNRDNTLIHYPLKINKKSEDKTFRKKDKGKKLKRMLKQTQLATTLNTPKEAQ